MHRRIKKLIFFSLELCNVILSTNSYVAPYGKHPVNVLELTFHSSNCVIPYSPAKFTDILKESTAFISRHEE
jgi:hypothetical protein